MVDELTTERLVLRQWRDDDREPWAALNADPAVRAHFPGLLTRAESDAAVDRFAAAIADRGWGLWAAEVRATGDFIGFIGMQPVPGDLPCAPAVEIGWRLATAHQGKGYATEGARRALAYAANDLRLTEIVAIATAANRASRRVMEKIGMTRDPAGDFVHPSMPADWPGRFFVRYRSILS